MYAVSPYLKFRDETYCHRCIIFYAFSNWNQRREVIGVYSHGLHQWVLGGDGVDYMANVQVMTKATGVDIIWPLLGQHLYELGQCILGV